MMKHIDARIIIALIFALIFGVHFTIQDWLEYKGLKLKSDNMLASHAIDRISKENTNKGAVVITHGGDAFFVDGLK